MRFSLWRRPAAARSAILHVRPGVMEPAFIALVNRGEEVAGTRTALSGVTLTMFGHRTMWDAEDVHFPSVSSWFDAVRCYNQKGEALHTKQLDRGYHPHGASVTIEWSAEGVLVSEPT